MTDQEDGANGDGSASDDAQFVAELRRALTRAATAETLVAVTPPDAQLTLIVQAATRGIPSPEGALMLVDHDARELFFAVAIGDTAERILPMRLPLGHGIAGLVAVSAQPLAVADAQADPRHARDIALKVGYLPNTILAVPVLAPAEPDRVIGVVELLDRQGQLTYSLADMELLGLFAQQAALVLEQRRAERVLAALVGRTMSALGGLPAAAERAVVARAANFAAEVAADPAMRRALALAELVEEIARAGEAEHEACAGVLEAFATYLRSRPALGGFGLSGLA